MAEDNLSTTKTVIDEEKHESHDAGTVDSLHQVTSTVKDKLHLHNVHVSGPSKLFNPTNVHFHVRTRNDGVAQDDHRELQVTWKSRDNRKGRNSVSVPLQPSTTGKHHKLGRKVKEVLSNVMVMATTFPYWDMAFWSGWSYSCGSVLFVVDGAFSWGPLAFPGTEHEGVTKWGVPLCFFFGACFYQIGATMAYFEAINDGSFAGSAMRRLLEGHEEHQKILLDEKLHHFFGRLIPHHGHDEEDETKQEAWDKVDKHQRRASLFPGRRRGGLDLGEATEGEVSEYMTWRWWPTWRALRDHHLREIGYIACTIQLFGATLYGITSVVILPGILDSLSWWQTLAAYWVPQCVASACFLTAGISFTLETQGKWYSPCLRTVGWWIGAWATIGSVGFLLSAVFGCLSNQYTWAEYQSSLSSMWGSAAYLLSSLLQWYESVTKGPVLAFPNNPNKLVSMPRRRTKSSSGGEQSASGENDQKA